MKALERLTVSADCLVGQTYSLEFAAQAPRWICPNWIKVLGRY